MKSWMATHKGHRIEVRNSYVGGEELLVDGELQDRHTGFALRSRLTGRIKTGDGQGEEIKVSLGGWWGVHCQIFVDHTRIHPS